MESEKLYQQYTNKKPDASGAFERMQQRMRWLRQYKSCGKCKQKLISVGILARGE